MIVRILGSAAGGGFPQWNCNCPNCAGFRSGALRAHARTQSSIAVAAGSRAKPSAGNSKSERRDWLLLNASPDIRAQLANSPDLQPARGARDTGIRAVLLTDSQIDHSSGLLFLREHQAGLDLYCSAAIRDDLTQDYTLLPTIRAFCNVRVHLLEENQSVQIPGLEGLRITVRGADNRAPRYSQRRGREAPGELSSLAVWLEDLESGGRLLYAPGLARIEESLRPWLEAADLMLLDGAFYYNDELSRIGAGQRTATDMGHLPLGGPGGLLEQLEAYPDSQKVLVHINNTNPILNEDSPERQDVEARGVGVGFDGQEFAL